MMAKIDFHTGIFLPHRRRLPGDCSIFKLWTRGQIDWRVLLEFYQLARPTRIIEQLLEGSAKTLCSSPSYEQIKRAGQSRKKLRQEIEPSKLGVVSFVVFVLAQPLKQNGQTKAASITNSNDCHGCGSFHLVTFNDNVFPTSDASHSVSLVVE